MKKINLWMFAAILTVCGLMTMMTSCSQQDNIVVPEKQTERAAFEKQLSTTLNDAVQLQNLQPTLRAAEVMTAFLEQLNVEDLAPQIANIMTTVLVNTKPQSFAELGAQEAEAREALKNTFSALAEAPMFTLTSAKNALDKTRMTFVEGEGMKYETGVGEGLTISYQNPKTNEATEITFKLDDAYDGVIMFITKMSGVPLAVQLPANISFTINRTQAGVPGEVMSGIASLIAPDGKKFISLQGSEWELSLATKAATANRFEVPVATMHHYADGRVDGEAGLWINETMVLGVAIQSTGDSYSEAEMENLKALPEYGAAYAAFYEVLKKFNSRSGKAQLTVMEDLVFDIDVKDIALAASALGSALKLRDSKPAKADIDPFSEQLNKAFTFTVEQRSTGVKAEGKIVTAEFDGLNKPALALRFAGEKDFKVMYETMTGTDRDNYESLIKSFDAPLRQLDKMFQAFNKKRQEFEKVNPLNKL